MRVAVLCNLESASNMLFDIKQELAGLSDRIVMIEEPTELGEVPVAKVSGIFSCDMMTLFRT